jgi:predicted PurR-regulated permease PerM
MQHPHIEWQKHEQGTLVLLVLLSLAGLFYVSSSFVFNILFAGIITLSTYPFFLKIKEKFKINNTKASMLTTVGVGAIFVAPITYVLTILSVETFDLYIYIQDTVTSIDFSSKENAVNDIITKANVSEEHIETVRNLLTNHIDIESIAKTSKDVLLFLSQNALGSFLGTFFFFIMALFTMFFLYRDGTDISQKIKDISPLHDYYDSLLMREMTRLSGILTLSIISLAFLQGASFALVTAFMDLNWLFLGVAVALTSFVPVFGTLIVWLPLGIYLYLTGNEFQGIFIIAWGVIVIATLIDNVLRPFIVGYICNIFDSKNCKINAEEKETFNPLNHTLIVTVSTLGGMLKFGVIGLFLGPIIAGISITVLEIYRIRLQSMQALSDKENNVTHKPTLDNANNKLEIDVESLIDEANQQVEIDLPDLPDSEMNLDDFELPEDELIDDIDDDDDDDIDHDVDLNDFNDEFDQIQDSEDDNER